MNYNEAVNYIFGLRKFANEPGVVRAKRALRLLKNPEETLKIIHIAGTNGKGSVCSYISNVLIKSGYNVGMFTSPHLVKVNERIRLNGVQITDEEFLYYFHKVYEVSESMKKSGYDGLAFFDYVFVMAVLYYADKAPDYVILETGLGGKNDATAAIEKKILTVITSISLDHTEILGDDISQIAEEKSGIIVEKTPLVCWRTDAQVAQIMSDAAKKCNSDVYFVDEKSFQIHKMTRKYIDFSLSNSYYKNGVFSIKCTGLYQVMNVALALEAVSVLEKLEHCNFIQEKVIEAVKETCWQGRMEQIEHNVYLDGAHNPDGIKRFLETASFLKGNGRLFLLFGAVCEKNHDDMIKQICNEGCFDGYCITQINNHRALNLDIMVGEFCKYTDKPIYAEVDNAKAYAKAKALLGENDVLMCAGSLYLIGALKELIGE